MTTTKAKKQPTAAEERRGAVMDREAEIAIGLRIALSEYYRGLLAKRLRLSLAKHYAGSASRLAHGELRDVVRGDRIAFTKAAEKVRTEDTSLREGAEEELRVVYPKLPRKLGVRLDERDVGAFWAMIDHALFPTLAAKKTEEVAVTKEAGRLWVAYQRGPVAVFAGAHAQGATKREALASLASMIAELTQAGTRLARQKWIRAITDAKLREEVMRLVLARGVIDERDFNSKDRKRLAQLDAESRAAFDVIMAGKLTGRRALRRVEDVKDRLDDLLMAPILDARIREIDAHPERLVTSAQMAERLGLCPRRRGKPARLTAEDRADLKIAEEGSRQLREHPETMIPIEEVKRRFGMKPTPRRRGKGSSP
jgi:hypothetical protein